jgi:predicted nucleic-acid-binding protein
LRYITHDIAEQADIVENLLLSREIFVAPEVIMEVVYILTKSYGYTRDETIKGILDFLDDADYHNAYITNVLKTFGATKLDFVDCLLLEYSKHPEYEVFTFDKTLKKMIDRGW